MTDDRPSIAELQRAHALYADRRNMQAAANLIDAAPVLLEIAAAALAWAETTGAPRGDQRADAAELALLNAITRMRP